MSGEMEGLVSNNLSRCQFLSSGIAAYDSRCSNNRLASHGNVISGGV